MLCASIYDRAHTWVEANRYGLSLSQPHPGYMHATDSGYHPSSPSKVVSVVRIVRKTILSFDQMKGEGEESSDGGEVGEPLWV